MTETNELDTELFAGEVLSLQSRDHIANQTLGVRAGFPEAISQNIDAVMLGFLLFKLLFRTVQDPPQGALNVGFPERLMGFDQVDHFTRLFGRLIIRIDGGKVQVDTVIIAFLGQVRAGLKRIYHMVPVRFHGLCPIDEEDLWERTLANKEVRL